MRTCAVGRGTSCSTSIATSRGSMTTIGAPSAAEPGPTCVPATSVVPVGAAGAPDWGSPADGAGVHQMKPALSMTVPYGGRGAEPQPCPPISMAEPGLL